MTKAKSILFLLFLLILAIMTFSLSKSWFSWDKGVKVVAPLPESEEENSAIKTKPISKTTIDDLKENSKVYWGDILLHSVGATIESGNGFGPDDILHHARNLVFYNLKTGSKKQLFDHDIYIWDYFPGEFIRRVVGISLDDSRKEDLNLEKRFIIFASLEDTNKDGFLNNKDRRSVLIYDPYKDSLTSLIPETHRFEKLLYQTEKNLLCLIVQKIKDKDQKEEEPYQVLTYRVETNQISILPVQIELEKKPKKGNKSKN
jgi:hypothetical protein